MAYNSEDRKACTRCGAKTYVTDPVHVCADVARRHARRVRQRDAVIGFLRSFGRINWDSDDPMIVGDTIVSMLARMGVEQD